MALLVDHRARIAEDMGEGSGREHEEGGGWTGQEDEQKDGDGRLAANRITRQTQAWASGDELNKDNVRHERLNP